MSLGAAARASLANSLKDGTSADKGGGSVADSIDVKRTNSVTRSVEARRQRASGLGLNAMSALATLSSQEQFREELAAKDRLLLEIRGEVQQRDYRAGEIFDEVSASLDSLNVPEIVNLLLDAKGDDPATAEKGDKDGDGVEGDAEEGEGASGAAPTGSDPTAGKKGDHDADVGNLGDSSAAAKVVIVEDSLSKLDRVLKGLASFCVKQQHTLDNFARMGLDTRDADGVGSLKLKLGDGGADADAVGHLDSSMGLGARGGRKSVAPGAGRKSLAADIAHHGHGKKDALAGLTKKGGVLTNDEGVKFDEEGRQLVTIDELDREVERELENYEDDLRRKIGNEAEHFRKKCKDLNEEIEDVLKLRDAAQKKADEGEELLVIREAEIADLKATVTELEEQLASTDEEGADGAGAAGAAGGGTGDGSGGKGAGSADGQGSASKGSGSAADDKPKAAAAGSSKEEDWGAHNPAAAKIMAKVRSRGVNKRELANVNKEKEEELGRQHEEMTIREDELNELLELIDDKDADLQQRQKDVLKREQEVSELLEEYLADEEKKTNDARELEVLRREMDSLKSELNSTRVTLDEKARRLGVLEQEKKEGGAGVRQLMREGKLSLEEMDDLVHQLEHELAEAKEELDERFWDEDAMVRDSAQARLELETLRAEITVLREEREGYLQKVEGEERFAREDFWSYLRSRFFPELRQVEDTGELSDFVREAEEELHAEGHGAEEDAAAAIKAVDQALDEDGEGKEKTHQQRVQEKIDGENFQRERAFWDATGLALRAKDYLRRKRERQSQAERRKAIEKTNRRAERNARRVREREFRRQKMADRREKQLAAKAERLAEAEKAAAEDKAAGGKAGAVDGVRRSLKDEVTSKAGAVGKRLSRQGSLLQLEKGSFDEFTTSHSESDHDHSTSSLSDSEEGDLANEAAVATELFDVPSGEDRSDNTDVGSELDRDDDENRREPPGPHLTERTKRLQAREDRRMERRKRRREARKLRRDARERERMRRSVVDAYVEDEAGADSSSRSPSPPLSPIDPLSALRRWSRRGRRAEDDGEGGGADDGDAEAENSLNRADGGAGKPLPATGHDLVPERAPNLLGLRPLHTEALLSSLHDVLQSNQATLSFCRQHCVRLVKEAEQQTQQVQHQVIEERAARKSYEAQQGIKVLGVGDGMKHSGRG